MQLERQNQYDPAGRKATPNRNYSNSSQRYNFRFLADATIMKNRPILAAMVTLWLIPLFSSLSGAAAPGEGPRGHGQPTRAAKPASQWRKRPGAPRGAEGADHAYQKEVELLSKISVETPGHPSTGAMDECQDRSDEAVDYYNNGIDLLQIVAKTLDADDDNSCAEVRQAMRVLYEAEKACTKCMNKVDEAIRVCTPDYETDSIERTRTACEKSFKTVEHFEAKLKRRAALACK
jgi:hypothetical protein